MTDTIELTESQMALRIYGGHVFIGGGRLTFVNCMFWDFELLIPLTDRLRIGGDVLVREAVYVRFDAHACGRTFESRHLPSICLTQILAGDATFTGCFWACTTWFGVDDGAGLNIAIFGGVQTFTFCHLMINNLVAVTATAGQNTFVAGGVAVFTGVHVSFNSGIEMFDGAGALTVIGGACLVAYARVVS